MYSFRLKSWLGRTLFFCITMVPFISFGYNKVVNVTDATVSGGYFSCKIPLQYSAKPTINISARQYTNIEVLPKGAEVLPADDVKTFLIGERKNSYLIIRVPIYLRKQTAFQKLESFQLSFEESEPLKVANKNTGFNDVPQSVLASGTWYKIGITKTGFYKLDFNFFNSLGITASSIDPKKIRIFGNGGAMLSENNLVSRPADLKENAIWVNDGGDNTFNNGDFAVFYGVGTTSWTADTVNKRFKHTTNLYSDTAFYFITVDNGDGLRIGGQGTPPTANTTSSGFDYRDVHELELVNPYKYGKSWFGETMSSQIGTSLGVSFDLGDVAGQSTIITSFAYEQGNSGSSMDISVNGSSAGRLNFWKVTDPNGLNTLVGHSGLKYTGDLNSRTLNMQFSYTPTAPSAAVTAKAYLDFVEVNARRPLNMNGAGQLSFRDLQTTGAGKITSFALQGANSNTQVWDITDAQVPVLMNGSLSGNTYTFVQNTSTVCEFAATNQSDFLTPVAKGTVNNQNLHGQVQPNLIIVTHPDFKDAAERVARYHETHDGMKVVIATTTQVYNEFSSGAQDVSAIRDYARMFYKRAKDSADAPGYLLLYGCGSIDYKNRLGNNANYVPTYETANDSSNLDGYLSDDIFGFLDDSENIGNFVIPNIVDIGVGRIPARNVTDANVAADKIIRYGSSASLGPWRIASMVVAEAEDGAGFHLYDAERAESTFNRAANNLYNVQKVYVDAMPLIVTPGGTRCPTANAAINDQIFQGVFFVNYTGHGNTEVWANERILTQDDFNSWNNINTMPFMVTATCDFGQFDNPTASAAELMVLHEGGGAIGIVTTTGAVYESFNIPMNLDFLEAQFTKRDDGTWHAFGDGVRISKNFAYVANPSIDAISNFRKFVLLGDPALTPAFPVHIVKTDSILDGFTGEKADTIKALGKYTLKGSVTDVHGALLSDFNGSVYISIFDKPNHFVITTGRAVEAYNVQLNPIYKGVVSVKNGKFAVTFIAPKDINYYMGKGKVSLYAHNGNVDGAGSDSTLSIGGYSDNPVLNDSKPIVHPYINDSMFINGGITGSSTTLFVAIQSVTGINVTGFGFGHNLMAILDGNTEQPYILNNYYQTAPNTYQLGYVNFPISGLADGKHSITVRAFDVNNNEGEGTVDFIVVDGKVMAIESLGNYPNPFSNTTNFVFEHNHPNENMNISINIFNAAGESVKIIEENLTPTGSRTAEISWDGTNGHGDKLPSGVYLYRLQIKTDSGIQSTAYQKLVIVR